MARPSPSCAHDDNRLRLPPASPPSSNSAEKKEPTGPRLSQLCPPCACAGPTQHARRLLKLLSHVAGPTSCFDRTVGACSILSGMVACPVGRFWRQGGIQHSEEENEYIVGRPSGRVTAGNGARQGAVSGSPCAGLDRLLQCQMLLLPS